MNRLSDRLIGFEPVVDITSRVLIVGSFPSKLSLQTGQYYANPRNDFWKIMGTIIGMPVDLPYDDRLSFLLSQGFGLWDVVYSCSRMGSSDSAIRDPEPAPIGSLLSRYPGISAVFCNGRRSETGLEQAMKLGQENKKRMVHTGYLPSSSPAHAVRFEEKCQSWMILRDYIVP
ncbi:DNA-deoxyinosine glycosylase [Methanospirillum lacunae]|uniref:DNA-deoxyinosine glycosylase n=1 Tax=Methanospirillum lacunae TaxID=668570 RepID=A0A2V2NC41_9EURY|nr:DNA-deoxyinosine glycosylase [Methanospirillum lacunae]PWR73917.1 DNA-deoxyinosine glycosylase [Methanospirillum lacunae]